MVEDGTQESGELGIAFACAGDRVDGRLRVGMCAARVGELGVIASAVVGKESAGFVECVVVGNAAEPATELLVGEELGLLVSRGFVKAGDKENLRGASARFEPPCLVRQLCAFDGFSRSTPNCSFLHGQPLKYKVSDLFSLPLIRANMPCNVILAIAFGNRIALVCTAALNRRAIDASALPTGRASLASVGDPYAE